MRYPLLLGKLAAKNTVIVYYNPQCPSARRLWPQLHNFMDGLDPQETKVVFQGGGFDEPGTLVMLLAAAFAEQDQGMAREYITAVIINGGAPFADPGAWTRQWRQGEIEAGREPATFDADRFYAVFTEGVESYAQGGSDLVRKYAIASTPTIIINGTHYTGERSAQAMCAFLESTTPRGDVP